MRFLTGLLVCLCFSVSLASEDTYRAGLIGSTTVAGDLETYIPLIQDAAKLKVDILVLPSPQISSSTSNIETAYGIYNYDELVQSISTASKQAGLYVVAHLLEKTRCQNRNQLVRSNLVFDRKGNVVSVYRKPVNNLVNCSTATESGTFTTDFGVTFGVLMEEDLVLQTGLNGLRNFVVTGAWSTEVPFLAASQFASSWAFANNVNLVTSFGVFAGRSGAKTIADDAVNFADLKKTGGESYPIVPPVVSSPSSVPGEDLSLYIIRPLDVTASIQGYKEAVCHGQFCCEFYIKTSFVGSKHENVNYGLAAFKGVRQFDRRQNIGARTCAIFACAGLYKRTCSLGSEKNRTNVLFEKISVSGNFTSEGAQYPIILTTSDINPKQFSFEVSNFENSKKVTLEMGNIELLSFGIFGRDPSGDSEKFSEEDTHSDIFETLNDEMQEFFDYIWIRLRFLIFIVSIYVLEMM